MKEIIEDTFDAAGIPVTLYRRKPAGVIYYYFRANGERHRESTKRKSIREARTVAQLAARKVSNVSKPLGALTLVQAIADCKAARWPDSSGDSYKDAKSRLAKFSEFAGEMDLALTSSDGFTRKVQEFANQRRKDKMSPRSIKNDQLVLSAFCSWILANKRPPVQWQYNPAGAEFLVLPPCESFEPEDVSEADVKLLLALAKGTWAWPLILLCLGCAARPVEACRVKWTDVDFEKRTVLLRGKRRERHFPLSDWAHAELQAWKASHENTERPFPWDVEWADDVLAKLRTEVREVNDKLEKVQILPPSCTLQALRVTACNKLMDAVEPRTYADLTGHSLSTADQHYRRRRKASAAPEVSKALNFGA